MNIKDKLEQDIKTAMLAGEKTLVTTLRGIKSVILYSEVASGKREVGLPEAEVITLLQKEAKKRQESADLYRQGNNLEKAEQEDAEKKVINAYLPAQISEEEIAKLVQQEIAKLDSPTLAQMGQVIGAVKKATGGAADGAVIARLTKESLTSE